MTAYYNEVDPKAAAWLRELISNNLIAAGDVDERSIEDVSPDDLSGYTQCHFFAGIGVWSYALRLAGWPDDRPIWTGSCPCQPFSAAGKGKGFDDERHLWPAFYWLIQQCRPVVVFGEQVAGKDGLTWLDLVSTDMEALDYSCGAVPYAAAGIGAPHIRERLYWVADSNGRNASAEGIQRGGEHRLFPQGSGDVRRGDFRARFKFSGEVEWTGSGHSFWRGADWLGCRDGKFRQVEPGTFPLAHGVAERVGLLRGYGNALVAEQAQAFIESYCEVKAMINQELQAAQ